MQDRRWAAFVTQHSGALYLGGQVRIAQGGTKLWCPHCREVRVCEAKNPGAMGKPAGQRWWRTGHYDIQWFRRGRTCQTCRRRFFTAELHEEIIDELVQLRDALKEVKEKAEAYLHQATATSRSIDDLGRSLSALRALEMYKDS